VPEQIFDARRGCRMANNVRDQVVNAVQTASERPDLLDRLLNVAPDERHTILEELGMGNVTKADMEEMVRDSRLTGGARLQEIDGGVQRSTIEWVGTIALLAVAL
jgi:hypothetical protein